MTLQEITPLIEQLTMPDKVRVYELLVKQIPLPVISNHLIKKKAENDIASKAEQNQPATFEDLLNLVAERDKLVWAELATK